MKQVSKFLAPVAFAAAAFCAPQAFASGQNATAASYLGNGTYIGIFDPSFTPAENTFISSTSPTPNASFTDYWVFDLNPAGNASASLSFTNISSAFTAFAVTLYQDTAGTYTIASQSRAGLGGILSASTAAPLTLVPQSSGNFGVGTQNGGAFSNTTTFLQTGRYVAVVTGTTGAGTNPTYSGQIQVNRIPEPGSLALSGVALLGAAAAMRKRKSA